MHEVETFIFHTLHEHGTFRCLDSVPSHVRHHIGVKQFHVSLDQTKARSAGAVFHTTFEHDLFAHAHTEHRSPGTQTIFDHGVSAHRLETSHACAESAHAGHYQTVGFQGLPMVGSEGHVKVEIGQRTNHGTHVAETIIENHHGSHGRSPSCVIRCSMA